MPLLPLPQQELSLVKRGLDAYFSTLRGLGITVDAPFCDDDYVWWGHWNDDAIEAANGGAGIATCSVSLNTGNKGRKAAAQGAYYLFSMIRHQVLHAAEGGGPWWQHFNRINARCPGKLEVQGPAAFFCVRPAFS